MKRILITGQNSYVGNKFEDWVYKNPYHYVISKISVRDDLWKEKPFNEYDVVFHVAGIAHVSTKSKLEEKYFKINRDLTLEIAKKAKKDGVKQFVFMSSIIVYGDSSSNKKVIDKDTVPLPSNFYGISKLQAEEGLKSLESDDFKVVVLRPPMIYGKGSKGNYPRLVKAAKKIPLFPKIDNERSMLHIDNLCEFVKVIIDNEESGIFFPQNKEYVNTSEMVRLIAETQGKKVKLVKIFNPIIKMLGFKIKFINKVFGNLVYDKLMSNYKVNYQIRDFHESIKLTEN